MRKTFWCVLSLLLVLACCTHNEKKQGTTNIQYADSTRYVLLHMEAQLPDAVDDVTSNVRASLLNVLYDEVIQIGYGEDVSGVMSEVGESDEAQDVMSYYGKTLMTHLETLAKGDADERASFGFNGEYPQWECDMNIHKVFETDDYWVYLSENYVYLGGAHGGVTGSGYLTYGKSDGQLIGGMLDESREKDMQPLLYEGVKSYFEESGDVFDEDFLFVQDGYIPFPQKDPCPMGDSILFVYQQYEIAPYAMGMPSFKLPMAKVSSFLKPEARKALGLD